MTYMEVEDNVSITEIEDVDPTYSIDLVEQTALGQIATYLKERDAVSLDEDGHILLDVSSLPDMLKSDIGTKSVQFLETISRIIKNSTEDTTGLIRLTNFDTYPKVDFDDINTEHIGQVIRTKVDVAHLEQVKETELRTPFMCQGHHITFNNFDRGDELKSPAKCRFASDEEEQCRSTPHRKMSADDLMQEGFPLKHASGMISITTQKLILSDAKQPDHQSRMIHGEIDQPLIYQLEERDTVEVAARVLSKENDDSRDKSYYLHILGYKRPESEVLSKERIEELEELSEKIDPLNDLASTVAKEFGIEDRGDGQALRAKKAALLSAVKGHSDMNNHNIHTLLYGPTGTGKSKTAESTAGACDVGEMIDMQKASDAGIAGSNVKSEELGGKYILQAGTLTQASGGVCVVDEIDKVDRRSDQNIFSEPMERGKINIDKTAKGDDLPADVSIIATANPDNNMYNRDAGLEALKIQDHIKDRFDLITKLDAYRTDGYGEDLDQRKDEIFQSLNMQLDGVDLDIDRETLSDYITLAKEQTPTFTTEAKEKVADKFVKIDKEFDNTSNRLRDTLTNVSTAIAKLQLSDEVRETHVERAAELYIDCWESVITDD